MDKIEIDPGITDEETFVFGLQEQMGSHEGFISRYETMTQSGQKD